MFAVLLMGMHTIYSGMRGVVDYTNYDDMKYAVGLKNFTLILLAVRIVIVEFNN